mgnify:FL=1
MKKIFVLFFIVFTLSACGEFSNEPQIFLNPGFDTVEQGTNWIDQGAFLQIGFTRIPMETSDVVDTQTIGFYDIHYQVTHEGVSYEVMRRVAVVEPTQFQASLNPGVDTIQVGDIWQDSGVTVPEGATVIKNGEVSFITPGTYEITYDITYNDMTVTLIRYVTVLGN